MSPVQSDRAAARARAAQQLLRTGHLSPGVWADEVEAGIAWLHFPPRKDSPGRLEPLLDLACRAVSASLGGLGFLSPDGDVIDHLTRGGPADRAAVAELLQLVSRQPAPTRVVDLAEAGLLPESLSPSRPLGPFLGIPLTCPGRGRGALYLARPRGEAPFAPQDEDLVRPLAAWLEQANLAEEARLLARLRVLTQVAQSAAGNLDLPSILAVTLRELDRHLPLNVCAVWLLDEGREPGSAGREPRIGGCEPVLALADTSDALGDRAALPGLVPGLRLHLTATPFGSCVTDSEALYVEWEHADGHEPGLADRSPPSPFFPVPGPQFPKTCCVAVPLRAGDRTVGVLQSVCLRPAGFTGEQIQLLYLVADLLGPAISSYQLFGRLSAAYQELRVAQNQLIQAEKMRALGELAGGVAHEFNNSLCGVLGFLEFALLNQGLDPSCRGFLESARTCASDAAQTVRRVKDFARWRKKDQPSQPVDVNELLRQTVELVRHKWEGRGTTVDARVAVEVTTEAAAPAAGNPHELREVLTNLMFNAVEAMPHGGTLRLRTWSDAASVYLSVSDSGTGIPAAVRHRLFEPFFTTKGEKGNGLGLSVAFGIVRRHGGEIAVESQEDRGSTFTVRLPAVFTGVGAPGGHLEAPAASPSAPDARRGLRLLVVEDEDGIRRFLSTGLGLLGHHVRLTATAAEGVAALAEEPFDLVLTDLSLPGGSGEEVAAAAAELTPRPPVLLLTGWADQLRAEKRTVPGVTRVLGKPVTLDSLAAALAEVMEA